MPTTANPRRLLLIPLVKAPDKVLIVVAAILFLQPIEIYYIIKGIIVPDANPMDLGYGHLWGNGWRSRNSLPLYSN